MLPTASQYARYVKRFRMSKRKRPGAVDATQLAGRRAERFRPNKVARLGNHQVEPPRHRGTAFDENGFVKNNAQRSNLLDFDQVDLDEYSDHDDEDRDEVIYDGRFPRRKQQPLRRLPKIERVTSIIPEFRRRHTTRNAYPWTRSSPATDSTEAKWRLHVEILEFYDFVRPHDFELKARKWVVDQIKHLVTAKGAPVKVLPFGSYATGLNLPTGDLDLVLVEPVWDRDDIEPAGKNQMRTALNKYSGLMRNSTFDTVNIIRHSRVPLIKFKERTTGIDVDLSFNNRGGIPAIDTVKQWAEQYRAMPPLVMIIKQLLLMRDLNDVAYQGMGSFTIICLVTSFLMNHPSQRIPQDREKNTRLGELLLDFLTFYGEEFDRDRKGIQMEQHQATYITKPKSESHNGKFYVIDPNNPPRNIASGTARVAEIVAVFRDAKTALERAIKEHEISGKGAGPASLLDELIGGDYQIYANQRAHLKEVAKNINTYSVQYGGSRRR